MGPVDALLHLLNFVAPGLLVGAMAAAVAKLVWRRELAAMRWRRLAAWAGAGGVLASIAGLVAFGRDGRMATYAAMAAACAAALVWAAFGPGRR